MERHRQRDKGKGRGREGQKSKNNKNFKKNGKTYSEFTMPHICRYT